MYFRNQKKTAQDVSMSDVTVHKNLLEYFPDRAISCIKTYERGGNMDECKKITLPEELQVEMLKFFMRTSIPRMKQERLEKEEAKKAENLSVK